MSIMPPAGDRMDALTDAILSVHRRLQRIEARLARLEAPQGIEAEAPPLAAPVAPAAPPPLPVATPPPLPMAAVEPAPVELAPPVAAAADPERTDALETRVGLTWINRIGVVTLVLAVAFFFKYAVDNRWIGEAGRVVLGVMAGFAALGLGEKMWRSGHRIYAQGITATGIAILYLSFYASFQLYRLVPQSFAFALMALTTAMAGALAIRYGTMAVSLLGLIGGFLTPLLLSTNVDRPWALFSYLLVLDAGALAVARARRWRLLENVAFAGTALLYASWFSDRFNGEKQVVATVFALAYYALFALVDSPVVFNLSQMLAGAAVLAIWSDNTSLWLALALAAAGLAVAERRGWPSSPMVVFGVFWLCCADRWSPGHTGEVVAVFTAGFLLFFGRTAWRLLVRRIETRAPDLTVLALGGAVYFGLTYHLLDPHYHAYMGLFAAALAGLHLALGLRIWNTLPAERRDVRPVLLLTGVALSFLTLAAPIQFSSFRITMAWAVEAAAMTWIGVRAGSKRLVWAALAVYALTLLRLYSIDSWIYGDPRAYGLLENARFLTFLVAAVSLWLSARWLKTGPAALGPYVAGHFVMLWGLGLEVLGWAERSTPAANLANVETVSISILMAAYGIGLVSLGFLTRAGINRMLGLGLLAAVVAKLYLYDVWQLQKIYRIVAFSSLGVALLATSFLYSRYRTEIEGWWRDEKDRS